MNFNSRDIPNVPPFFHSRESGNLARVKRAFARSANIGAPHKCGEIPAFAGMEIKLKFPSR